MGARPLQKRCKRDHDDWVTDKVSGYRRCKTCHTERNRRRRRSINSGLKESWADHTKTGDRGGREDTFSRTEILKARGYV